MASLKDLNIFGNSNGIKTPVGNIPSIDFGIKSPNSSTATGVKYSPAPTSTPVPSLGLKPKSPTDNLSTSKPTLQPKDMKLTSQPNPNAGGIDYNANPLYLRPGESKAQYDARNNTQQAPAAPVAPAAPATPAPTGYQVGNGLYGQLVTGLANKSQPSQQYTDAYTKAQDILGQQKQLQDQYAEQTKNIETSPIDLSLATGEQGVLARLLASKQANLSNQYAGATNLINSANTQQGLQQSALSSAAGLAQPTQVPYSNQFINPITGEAIGGSGGSLNDAVSGVVSKLTNGQMSYNDALNALSGYGQGGVNALQKALPPGFNVAQSNTLAGQQGSVGPALEYARAALSKLKSTLGNLQVPGQTSNIPLVGGISSFISGQTGIGGQQTQERDSAIAEARQSIQSVLASVRGGTPSDYTGQSHTILPDNATPQQVDAAISTLESLGTAKQNIYGNPGQSGSQSSPSSSGSNQFSASSFWQN